MAKNLLSIHMLTSNNNLNVQFDNHGCVLRDRANEKIIARGILRSGLYEFTMQSSMVSRSQVAAKSPAKPRTPMSETYLWHSRLGHVHAKKLKQINQSDIYLSPPRFNASTEFFSESCVFGKHHALPYVPSGSSKASKLLSLSIPTYVNQ